MGLRRIEAIKIKVRVGDSILFIEEMKENLSEASSRPGIKVNRRWRFVSLRKTHIFTFVFAGKNNGIRIKAKVNDIGVADIYPCADVKNGIGAGFVHDKNVLDKGRAITLTTWHLYFTQCQLCASGPVCVKGRRQIFQEVLAGNF